MRNGWTCSWVGVLVAVSFVTLVGCGDDDRPSGGVDSGTARVDGGGGGGTDAGGGGGTDAGMMVATDWETNALDHDCMMPGVIGSRFMYSCPAGGVPDSVWGTDLYTHDSSVCTAAAHDGRITIATGGVIMIEMAAGAMMYTGSTRNGITSMDYGTWGCSFTLP